MLTRALASLLVLSTLALGSTGCVVKTSGPRHRSSAVKVTKHRHHHCHPHKKGHIKNCHTHPHGHPHH